MKVNGQQTRSIWVEGDGITVGIIDQTLLPYRYATLRLETVADAARAIKSMQVRGAPLIGAVAAYGMALALREDASDAGLERAYALLIATRPTAINLKWALDEMMAAVRNRPREDRVAAAYKRAQDIADEDVEINAAIGRHGLRLIEEIAAKRRRVREPFESGLRDLVLIDRLLLRSVVEPDMDRAALEATVVAFGMSRDVLRPLIGRDLPLTDREQQRIVGRQLDRWRELTPIEARLP